LEPASEIVGCHEVGEVRPELVVALVVEALDGSLLDGAVHPLDLTVRPRVVRFGEPVLDAVRLADHVEAHLARPCGVSVAWLLGELDAIAGQDRVDAVGHGCQQVFQELPRCPAISLVDQLGDRELAGAIDADEQVQFAFGVLHLSDIHVKEADRVALEALPLRLIALDVSGRRDVPCRCRQRCSADRVSCGIGGCNA